MEGIGYSTGKTRQVFNVEYFDKSKIEAIKKKVLIPKYFEQIIVPEMKGYYSDYPADFSIRPMVKCPLHTEDTPSFRWYEETNTFFCFGCRVGGDVIHLHRKFMSVSKGHEPSFIDTLKFLNDYFLLGKEVAQPIEVSIPEAVESSNVEQLRLLSYIHRLEDRLASSSIPLDKKVNIYDLIDKIQVLVGCKRVNALEALEFLKANVLL